MGWKHGWHSPQSRWFQQPVERAGAPWRTGWWTDLAADAAAYSQRVAQYNCALGARIHNLTNLRQREHARDKSRGWEENLRELSADRRTAQAAAPGQPLPGSMR